MRLMGAICFQNTTVISKANLLWKQEFCCMSLENNPTYHFFNSQIPIVKAEDSVNVLLLAFRRRKLQEGGSEAAATAGLSA